MIKVDLDKIITRQALEKHLDSILYKVEDGEELFVITKKGRPRAALINVDYLEEITNRSVEQEAEEYEDYEKFAVPQTPAESVIKPIPAAGPKPAQPSTADRRPPIADRRPPIADRRTTEELPELDLDDIDFDDESNAALDDEPTATTETAVEAPKPPTSPTPAPTPAPVTAQPAAPIVPTPPDAPNKTANNTIDLESILKQMPVPPVSDEEIRKTEQAYNAGSGSAGSAGSSTGSAPGSSGSIGSGSGPA